MNVMLTSSARRDPGVILGTDRNLLSDEEGRSCDQQGWYHGKCLPSLDGAGVLIHNMVKMVKKAMKSLPKCFGGENVT